MFNNILKQEEEKYLDQVIEFVKSQYGKGFGTDGYNVGEGAQKFVDKLTKNKSGYTDFAKDFEEGLRKLNATFIDLQKTALEKNATAQNSNNDIDPTQEFIDLTEPTEKKKLSSVELVERSGLKNAQQRIADQLKRHSDYEAHPTMTQYVVNALKDFADWVCDLYCKHFGKDKAIPLLCKAFETMNRDEEKINQAEATKKMDELWKNYYKTIELIHKKSERDLSDAPQTDPNQPLGQQLGQPDLSNLIKERNEIEKQLGIGIIESILRSLIYSVKQTINIK